MQIILNVAFVLVVSLASTVVSAAALCPPHSCNPHNGCMEGCGDMTAYGTVACNPSEPQLAEEQAIAKGIEYAYRSCRIDYFLTSPWQVKVVETAARCEVKATATFSCLH
jgi:hypothetical protein